MLQKTVPVLPALHIRATIDFYESNMGFKGINLGSYIILTAGIAEIHFVLKEQKQFYPAACFIYTDNVEDLFTSLAAKDLPFTQNISFNFGKKSFSIKDNNGNTIHFGN